MAQGTKISSADGNESTGIVKPSCKELQGILEQESVN